MKATAWFVALILIVVGMVTAVYLRIDPNAPLELEPDGALFIGGRRVADDEESAERFFVKRQQGDPLVLRVAPKTDVVHLIRVLRAAHLGRKIRKAIVNGEPLALPQRIPHTDVILEIRLSLCPRSPRHLSGTQHLGEAEPGDLLFLGIYAKWFEPVATEEVDVRLAEIAPDLAFMARAVPSRSPPENVGIVDTCPGVTVETALKACRALRESGAGDSELEVRGEGNHWREDFFQRR